MIQATWIRLSEVSDSEPSISLSTSVATTLALPLVPTPRATLRLLIGYSKSHLNSSYLGISSSRYSLRRFSGSTLRLNRERWYPRLQVRARSLNRVKRLTITWQTHTFDRCKRTTSRIISRDIHRATTGTSRQLSTTPETSPSSTTSRKIKLDLTRFREIPDIRNKIAHASMSV